MTTLLDSLKTFETQSWDKRCQHKRRIPGNDADLCPQCLKVFNQKWWEEEMRRRKQKEKAEAVPVALLIPESDAPDIRVVNLRTDKTALSRPGAVYAARAIRHQGEWLKTSPLCNPYRIGEDGTRAEVCEKFRSEKLYPALDKRSGPLWNELSRLSDRILRGEKLTLCCWCAPSECHAFDIASAVRKIVEERRKD